VSTENPHLLGNRLLNTEIDRSPDLKGFIDQRGGPAAIEVVNDIFSALQMRLYYPENNHYYDSVETSQGWLIDGPKEISVEKRQQLLKVVGALEVPEEPLAPQAAMELNSGKENVEAGSDKPAQQDTKVTIPVDKQNSASLPNSQVGDLTLRLVNQYKLEPVDQDARGDVVHQVTQHGESTQLIALWYTHDSTNAARIARLNQLRSDIPLDPTTEVVIPAYLIKTKAKPTSTALSSFAEQMAIAGP